MTFGTPPRLVAALAVVAALTAYGAAVSTGPSRVFFLVPALAAAGEALRCVLLGPTIVAGESGLTVVHGLRRETFPWAMVEGVAPLAPPSGGGRMRRQANALEIDLGERLLVIPGYRLGAPVRAVVEALSSSSRGIGPGS